MVFGGVGIGVGGGVGGVKLLHSIPYNPTHF